MILAAAPSAPGSANWAKVGVIGQNGPIKPPERAEIGASELFRSLPNGFSQSLRMQNSFCSLPKPRKPHSVLGGVGALLGLLSGTSPWKSGGRMLGLATLAAGVTYGLGRLFGATLG